MHKLKSILYPIIWGLVYLLPVVLFFSYYPVISLGSDHSMNFELSLPLIWLVIFDFVAFLALFTLTSRLSQASRRPGSHPHTTPAKTGNEHTGMWGFREYIGISDRRIFLFSLFPFFATLSIFWSANPLRAVLTAGIIWLLFFAIFVIIYLLPLLPKPQNLTANLVKVFFGATTIVCLWCLLQSLLDICGFSRQDTLLCAGCTSITFGFPHPSGFAIEPQFMGNLLLAPTLTGLYLIIFHHKNQTKLRNTLIIIATSLFSFTLFFTFSRGAIYAYAVALLTLFIFALKRHQFRAALILIPVATFLASLGLQGVFAEFGPTSETFLSGVTKSIHHLSLGKIDLRRLAIRTKAPETTSPKPSSSYPYAPDLDTLIGASLDDPIVQTNLLSVFDGYVAESTNIRLRLNQSALDLWHSTPTNMIFGVGLGGAGTALYRASAVDSPKEIVQNQPISLLLELGLVGSILAIFSLLIAFFPQIFPKNFLDGKSASLSTASSSKPTLFSHLPAAPLLLSLVIAYLITLQFFSGLPNALHIYLLPPLLYFAFVQNPTTKFKPKNPNPTP